MIGILVIVGLACLGRILSLAWDQKPLGPDDFFLLASLIIAGVVLWYFQARKQRRLETSTAPTRRLVPQPTYGGALDNWLFENDDAKSIEDSDGADRENGDARRLSEDFFHGRYHWWGDR
jgi:hypothetical protein